MLLSYKWMDWMGSLCGAIIKAPLRDAKNLCSFAQSPHSALVHSDKGHHPPQQHHHQQEHKKKHIDTLLVGFHLGEPFQASVK